MRQGLRLLIDNEDGLRVLAEAGTVPDAERLTRAHQPSVLVLDLNMPGGSSLEAIPRLRADVPDTAIVVLTMQDDPAFARQALRAGALGFVLKEAAEEELLEAIRAAATGHTYLNPSVGARLAAQPTEPAGPPDNLTEREAAVLRADRPRAHQHRDRAALVPLLAHDRDPPRAPSAEAAPDLACRAGPLRVRTGARQALRRPSEPSRCELRLRVAPAVHLSRTFGEKEAAVRALDDVSVDFPTGGFTAIMGPSGSGKSTLMHLLAGLDRPTSGSVAVDGTELSGLDDGALTRLRRDRLGFVFQGYNLVPVLSAEENILLPFTLAGLDPDRAWFDELVSAVGIGDRLRHLPSELSGGQQQRVAVARALIRKPAVVFADEPTGNLDSTASAEVLALLRRAADEFGQTIVMVTHDAGAAAYADRLVVLADGRIVRDEPAGDAASVLELMKTV